MDIVIDTSAILAVLVGEPERDRIVEMTAGNALMAPASLRWEIGNAFSAMLKQRRLNLREAQRGLKVFEAIPIRYLNVDLVDALALADRTRSYAYDAYMLDCASRHAAPLLTLDHGLMRTARELKIEVLEV